MKIAIATTLLATASTASAFVPLASKNAATVSRMSEEPEAVESTVEEEIPAVVAPRKSQALPWMEVSPALDGTMAGDVGFDPLGFAKTKEDLMNYREAEVSKSSSIPFASKIGRWRLTTDTLRLFSKSFSQIKHARLAMLAAAGWPLSELYDKKFANLFHLPAVLDSSDRAPSVLNGGLGKISPIYWAVCLGAAAAIDLYGIKKASNEPGYFPGNYNFDPLGLYPKDPAGQQKMQLAEIKNGRLAMIAITAFAFQELVTQSGVVDATPRKFLLWPCVTIIEFALFHLILTLSWPCCFAVFFKPLDTVMRDYANSGYYIPE